MIEVGDLIVKKGRHYEICFLVCGIIRWEGSRDKFNSAKDKESYYVGYYDASGNIVHQEMILDNSMSVIKADTLSDKFDYMRREHSNCLRRGALV